MKPNKSFLLFILALSLFVFTLNAKATDQVQPELFPGVYLIETQWHPDTREFVYFILDDNISVVGWSDRTRHEYLTDLASGLTPAVFLNSQQVSRLLYDITIVFVAYDKDGMPVGTLKFTKELYLKWFWHNTL